MRPLPYVWPFALLFWVAFSWAYFPEFAIVRKAQRDQGETDSRSLQVILAGQSIAFVLAFPLAWVPALQFPAAQRVTWFFIGVVAMLAGSLIRRHCWRMLGTSFTGDVRVRAGQEVIQRGAYRFVRHPSYTGGILLNTGVGIALGSWLGALLLAVASFASYSYRMAVEERALLAEIGEPYRDFMSTRKRLFPFVY
jgi:protein-S-isoprenylcysteine O-methyltransferase Ste14